MSVASDEHIKVVKQMRQNGGILRSLSYFYLVLLGIIIFALLVIPIAVFVVVGKELMEYVSCIRIRRNSKVTSATACAH